MRFSLGVNYWPRLRALDLWQHFEPAEIRADFDHIAALGLDTVRVFARWDLLAPRVDEVDATMVARLAALLSLAGDAGLRVMPSLCGYNCGINRLPMWALDARAPRGRYRTFTGDREASAGPANPYAGPLLDAQVSIARALGERLSDHPAIAAWDIGHAFSNVREPSHSKVRSGEHSQSPADEQSVADWSRRMADALRADSAVAVTAGTHAGDLTEDRDIRLGSLCAPFAFASMQGSNVTAAFARGIVDPESLPFLATLAAGFSYQPVLVTSFGNPTCPPGKFAAFDRFAEPDEPPNPTIVAHDPVFAAFACVDDERNAAYCTATLERLHADGRLGAFWWSWADYGEDVAARPPFDEAPHERWCGIVRADGSEKPVARAFAAFAAQRREVVRARDMPMIASAYYYRTLPTSTRTLYDAFLRFVSDRRA